MVSSISSLNASSAPASTCGASSEFDADGCASSIVRMPHIFMKRAARGSHTSCPQSQSPTNFSTLFLNSTSSP